MQADFAKNYVHSNDALSQYRALMTATHKSALLAGFIIFIRITRSMRRFTIAELDKHFVHRSSQGNGLAAHRMYKERFLDKN